MTGVYGPPPPMAWPSENLTRSGSRATALVNTFRATAARTGEPAATATSGHRSALTAAPACMGLMLVVVTGPLPGVDERGAALVAARVGRAWFPASGSGR